MMSHGGASRWLRVTEPASGCSDIDFVDEHGRCGEVPEVVQPNVTHPLPLGKPSERERGVVRIPRDQASGRCEKTRHQGGSSSSAMASARTMRSRSASSTRTVPSSSATRRSACVFVSFSMTVWLI